MKVELYGARANRGGFWLWSIALDSDRVVANEWGLFLPGAEIIRITPGLAAGQAVYLAERLNGTCKTNASLGKLRRELLAGCLEIGIHKSIASQIHIIHHSIPTQASTSSRAPLNNRVLDQLIRILAGRFLLPEELIGLMQASGLEEWAPVWQRYVQAGVCLGRMSLSGGMDLTVAGRLLGGKVMTAACRRCGTTGSMDIDGPGLGGAAGIGDKRAILDSSTEAIVWTRCADCGGYCPYCSECITMGRIRHCSLLIKGLEGHTGNPGDSTLGTDECRNSSLGLPPASYNLAHWSLSPAQEEAAGEGLRFLERTALTRLDKPPAEKETLPQVDIYQGVFQKLNQHLRTCLRRMGVGAPGVKAPEFLIWAVTGAGKTEMIFPLMEYELERGRRVLLATPRRDVVLELKPRLEKAFPGRSVAALYGGSEDRWKRGDITLATTHQLMRFYQAFDLVIVDELDAFPYHNSPSLQFAARQACRSGGRYVYLSATPPMPLQKAARRGELPHVKVPVRFHRHPLPVPVRLSIPPLRQMVRAGRMPRSLVKALQESVDRGAQIFLFVSRIALVEPFMKLLNRAFPNSIIAGTSSKDEERGEKVMDFRNRKIDLLVTTTILERGVTVPKTDVFVIDADAGLFDEASLVQMAGRAGRSKDDPFGRVYFASKEWTQSQKGAIRQITSMNRIAGKKGYLLGQGREKQRY